MQNTNTILMVRPVAFTYNTDTAVNNKFQAAGNAEAAQRKALEEFDAFVVKLRENDMNVIVFDDTPEPHTPDSIFPNNWISFHNGTVVLYPMFAANRRTERKQAILDAIIDKFNITATIDLTGYESDNIFLEGTGSMVLDRDHNIAYACLSERTDKNVLDAFCKKMHYTPCSFRATDVNDSAIYHTNVMMSVADKYVVICLESIKDIDEQNNVIATIKNTGKEILPISFEQMNRFAGNVLQLENNKGEKLLVMSEQAFKALTYEEISKLQKYNRIIYSKLDTIEMNGGGSARCMIAEVF